MIDPRELETLDPSMLHELRTSISRLQELEEVFTMPGWEHLKALLEFKEHAAMEGLLSLDDIADVKARRELVKFIRWLLSLPGDTRLKADVVMEQLDAALEEYGLKEEEMSGESN